MTADFQNPEIQTIGLPCLPTERETPIFKFERDDWVAFRSLDTLGQKAGVPVGRLRRLVLKELVDNALDAGGSDVSLRQEGQDSYVIADRGPGIDGTPDEVAHLFSVIRPSISSKQWRLPTRGALGNGLRVAVGSVLVSDGSLIVTTRNRRHVLTPCDDGHTDVKTLDVDFPIGTKIEITFGSAIPHDNLAMSWALRAIQMAAGAGPEYAGKTSPFWYDADAMFELLQGAGERPVRDLIANMDGCSGAKAGKIAADFLGMASNALDRNQAVALLGAARSHARPVRPERLGGIGRTAELPEAYAKKCGTFHAGGRAPKAEVPFVVEAWARLLPVGCKSFGSVCVNRTPVADDIKIQREKSKATFIGGGIGHYIDIARGEYEIVVNITTPFCPVTDSGKRPDFSQFIRTILEAIESSVRRARVSVPVKVKRTQKSIVLDRLDEAIDKASGGGKYRFAKRQMLYVLRPYVQRELGVELTEANLGNILTEYEEENGEIELMYRDPRGTLHHPHGGTGIPMGTLAVEAYERPPYTYNKILYIEKEGFVETLKAAEWPEQHDCALISSKGFTTRAVKDLIDGLADSDEPVHVYCIHDADAAGTLIYHTLQNATKARGTRLVEVVNLGLEPWEALAMGLDAEDVKYDKRQPVAGYILNHSNGHEWSEWLQRHRVELNAMTSPQMIAWLDEKMGQHSIGKVIPPSSIVIDSIRDEAEEIVRSQLREQILRAANLNGQVAQAIAEMRFPTASEIEEGLPRFYAANPTLSWRNWVRESAHVIAANDNEPADGNP